ncbi:MAG: Crp/Fnr family transcriptional regulator [Planctomycetia bacterium]|nr:Crp/Fnr family transcriptional regulator [Planctomycetia bacterium]
MNELVSHLKSCAAFAGASTTDIRHLASGSKLRSFATKATIYVPSDTVDALYLLVEGRVAVGQVSPLGKRSWLTFVSVGQLFGEQSLLGWPRREQIAVSFEPSRLLAIPSSNARRVMSESTQFAGAMMQVVGERLAWTSRRWSTQFYLSTRERIIHVLLDLAEQYGTCSDNGTHLRIEMSHDDLAGFVGSTRESVSVELGKLRAAGLISTTRRRFVLRDVRHLAKLVNREARRAMKKC